MNLNPVFEFLHGKPYKLDGMSGVLQHTHCIDCHGILRQELYFNIDARGRRTKYYQDRRRELGDDWSRCLTQDIDTYCRIARELGCE